MTASYATKVLNAPLPALTGTLTGVKNGDDITASYATTATQASPVGEYPITATLNDPSGRLANYTVSNTSATLDVIYSTTCGRTILEPVNADGSSVFKTGRTVPAKFIVCDAAGLSIGTPGVVSSFHLVRVDYGTVSTDVSEPVTATNDMQFRWTGSHWMFNMSTSGLAPNRTYTYRIGLNDGTSIEFRFGLR